MDDGHAVPLVLEREEGLGLHIQAVNVIHPLGLFVGRNETPGQTFRHAWAEEEMGIGLTDSDANTHGPGTAHGAVDHCTYLVRSEYGLDTRRRTSKGMNNFGIPGIHLQS